MLLHRPTLLALIWALLPLGQRAVADVVELDSGGHVAGQVAKQDAANRARVLVALPGGGRVVLNRADVQRTIEQSPEALAYGRRAALTPDTVADQWALAQWCRDQKLTNEFQAHLERVVELDPNHDEARTLLGFRQHRGKWMTRDDVMASRGMIRYEGDYRTAQEIELLERAARGERLSADWRKRLERWRRDLSSSDPQESQEAAESFGTLTDPAAASALVRLLRDERNEDVKALLIETAARIEHPGTVQALATLSLKDPHREVRQQCLEHLVKARRPGLAEIYTRALGSKDNVIVNRAAEALSVAGATGAVSALIEALVTTHEFKQGRDTPRDTYSMDSSGGFQFGGGKAKSTRVNAKNPEVLSALVELTGQNFGFDEAVWNRWLATRAVAEEIDLRRDP